METLALSDFRITGLISEHAYLLNPAVRGHCNRAEGILLMSKSELTCFVLGIALSSVVAAQTPEKPAEPKKAGDAAVTTQSKGAQATKRSDSNVAEPLPKRAAKADAQVGCCCYQTVVGGPFDKCSSQTKAQCDELSSTTGAPTKWSSSSCK